MSRLRYLIMRQGATSDRGRQVALDHHLEPIRHGALIIYVSKDSETSIQRCRDSVLIGRVYPRACFGPPRRQAVLGDGDFEPDRLLHAFWGDYLLVDGAPDRAAAYRSPSGRMPAYYASQADGWAIASDCDLLIAMGFASGAIDWEGCARRLVHFEPLMEQTALDGVREILPGCSLGLSNGRVSQRNWWRPWEIGGAVGERAVIPSTSDIRALITDCVQAQVDAFDHILVRVSGGLDSSIVASSLASRDPRTELMVLIAGDGDGDERHYARQVAEQTGYLLHEVRYGVDDVDLDAASYPELPVPLGRHISQAIRRITARHLADRSHPIVLTGYGGDNLFCSLMSVRPIVDRLYATGLAGAIRTLMDVARTTESSAVEALSKTVRFLVRGGRRYRPEADATLIHRDWATLLSDLPMHPARPVAAGLLPGKDMHLAMILGALRYVEHHARPGDTAEISPFIAQPIMEACLSIPSWDWSAGGQDRSVAREAFSGLLPTTIIRRRSKGGPDAFCQKIVEERRDQLRERLLDGVLAQFRILDRDAVEDSLRSELPLSPRGTVRLLQLSDAEAWARARLDRHGLGRQATPPASQSSA